MKKLLLGRCFYDGGQMKYDIGVCQRIRNRPYRVEISRNFYEILAFNPLLLIPNQAVDFIIIWMVDELIYKMASDKTGSTGNKYNHLICIFRTLRLNPFLFDPR